MRAFECLISRISEIVRGRKVDLPTGFSASLVLSHMAGKGFVPLLRGVLARAYGVRADGTFFLGKNVKILAPTKLVLGRGCFIGSNSYIDALCVGNVNIGARTTIREFAWIQLTSNYSNPGEYISIGESVYIGPYSIIGAGAPIEIGSGTQIGARVSLVAENHEFKAGSEIREQGVSRRGIRVGRDCWLGNNVTVLDGVSIGDGAVIGAGSVVTKDIAPRAIAYGVPARTVRFRE